MLKALTFNAPCDLERDFFIEICTNFVPFLSKASINTLNEIYYRSNQQFYELD